MMYEIVFFGIIFGCESSAFKMDGLGISFSMSCTA